MGNAIKVGITGGIGSGKSTVARMFKEKYDIPVYYSDIWAKEIMSTKSILIDKIRLLLGPEAYHLDGKLNTRYIASKVFNDKELLEKLNNIVHPAVAEHFNEWAERKNTPYVLYESAILFESGRRNDFDRIITVYADEEERIKRTIQRDGCSREEVIKRINTQIPQEQKQMMSNYVINNNPGENIEDQVSNIHKYLLTFVV